mmetsp:Transcript_42944/g.87867  ORF Transcript_42944/g.87867 Transcript_42944/m.87867 type:complete len:815 (+) Transcript_42944:283-2727(+)
MTTADPAGIDSLLKEIRKYTDKPGEPGSNQPNAESTAPSMRSAGPAFEPPPPGSGTLAQPGFDPPRPPPAPRSPIQPPVDRDQVENLGLDDILAKISSVTGQRKSASNTPTSSAPPAVNRSQSCNISSAFEKPTQSASPAQPPPLNKSISTPLTQAESSDSRDRYHAELARLDAEISKFKASMKLDTPGSGSTPQKAPVAAVSKPPASMSEPVTPKTSYGAKSSYLLHPDGDISQVGSFEGAKEDLQKSISRMQEALKMSREMRAQLIPETPPQERRSSENAPIRTSPSVVPAVPVRSSAAPVAAPVRSAPPNNFSNTFSAEARAPPPAPAEGSAQGSPWARSAAAASGQRYPGLSASTDAASASRYPGLSSSTDAASAPAPRYPGLSASTDAASYAPPPWQNGGRATVEYQPEGGEMSDVDSLRTKHNRWRSDLDQTQAQEPMMMRQAPPRVEAQRKALAPLQSVPRPPPAPTQAYNKGATQQQHQQLIQQQLKNEIHHFPVDETFRRHLHLMIEDGSIRTSKELRAYIEQQFRSSGYLQRASPAYQQPQHPEQAHNLSRSVDGGGTPRYPNQNQQPQYPFQARATPRAMDPDAEILSQSFDEINQLVRGGPPPFMQAPPPPRPPNQSHHPGQGYGNPSPGPMRPPMQSPGAMQQQPLQQRQSAGPMLQPPMQQQQQQQQQQHMQQHRQMQSAGPMQPPMHAYQDPNAYLNPQQKQQQQYSPPQMQRSAPPPPMAAASPRHQALHPPHYMQPGQMASPFRGRDPSPFQSRPQYGQMDQASPTDEERAYIPLSEVPQDVAASLISEGYSQGAML